MKNEKIVKYSDIGTVLYRKNSRARNISIRISSAGEVKVTVPRFCNYSTAERFVLKKHAWIKKKLLSIERKNEKKLAFSVGSILSTPEGKVYIEQGEGEEYEISQANRDYQVFLPRDFSEENEEAADLLIKMIAEIGLKEAKVLLPGYLESIAQQFGFVYKKVGIRKMTSRWGSCSPDNNISLNSALIFLPYRLIEYVLLHELVHTVHKNHGNSFWGALEAVMPDAKARRKEMNKYPLA